MVIVVVVAVVVVERKEKVKFSLFLVKHHALNTCWGVELQLQDS
jgi:hypothetical protein